MLDTTPKKYHQHYRETHRKEINEIHKKYRETHAEQIKQLIKCECGREISKRNIAKHRHSKIHKELLQEL